MLRRINLQLFAGEAMPDNQGSPDTTQNAPIAQAPQGQPAPVQPTLSVDERVSQLFADANAKTGEADSNLQGTPQVEANTGQPIHTAEEQLILGKFKTTEDAFKGYQNLQSEFTKRNQTLSETQKAAEALKTQNAELAAKIEELTKSNANPAAAQETVTDDLESMDSDAFMQKFYDDPKGMIAALAEKTAMQKYEALQNEIKPVLQEREIARVQQSWDNEVLAFQKANPDVGKFVDDMKTYLQERNLASSNNPKEALEAAYHYARSNKYQEPQQIDPKTYLQDQNFVEENIYKNPVIAQEIMRRQMQQINQTQVPPSISGPSNAPSIAVPPNKARNMEEAHNLFEASLRNGFVGQ